MAKYIVYFNKDKNIYEVRKVTIVEEKNESCKVKVDSNVFFKKKTSLFDSKEYADIVRKEIIITKRLKDNMKDYRCPLCGKKMSEHDITVDHIVPKKYFYKLAKEKYNVDDYRLVQELWQECWRSSNLQVTCFECNHKKSCKNTVLNNFAMRKSYLNKKYESVNRGNRKVHLRNSKQCMTVQEDILKRFGNTFDMRAIKPF